MSELKPCPFCGGEAKTWADRTDFYVACYKCHIDMSSGKPAEAIEAWNRRAQPAQAGQVLTDDKLLAMWEGTDGERALRPTLGKNKILSFARAIEQAVLAKRVPMTNAQIRRMYAESWSTAAGADFQQAVRAAEKFHGIVGEKGGA